MTAGGRGPDEVDEVITASAYVLWRGRYVFMFGVPAGATDRLGVARLGGHVEAGEGPWVCAAREVQEECGLTIRPVVPPATYWIGPGQDEHSLSSEMASWSVDAPDDPVPAPRPLLVGWRPRLSALGTPGRSVSPTYLTVGEGQPEPAAETQGLLLLRPTEVRAVARGSLTLAGFLDGGGEALMREPLPPHLPLVPLTQLRVLAVLLDRHPELSSG